MAFNLEVPDPNKRDLPPDIVSEREAVALVPVNIL